MGIEPGTYRSRVRRFTTAPQRSIIIDSKVPISDVVTLIHVIFNYFAGIRKYEKESSRADNLNTCRISPYLHFGQISPRAVLTEARHMKSPKFLRKLAWRDLSYWLLTLWPDLPSMPTRLHYRVSGSGLLDCLLCLYTCCFTIWDLEVCTCTLITMTAFVARYVAIKMILLFYKESLMSGIICRKYFVFFFLFPSRIYVLDIC